MRTSMRCFPKRICESDWRVWARKSWPAPRASLPTTSRAKFRSGRKWCAIPALGPSELEDIEAGVAIADVHEPALVHVHVVGLRRCLAGRRLGNEVADFLRRRRIG